MARAVQDLAQPAGDSPDSREFVAAQQNARVAWDSFYALCPIADGVLHEDVVLTAGTDKDISHGLGRPYRGFIVVRKNEYGTAPGDNPASTAAKATTLTLQASAGMTVTVWVF